MLQPLPRGEAARQLPIVLQAQQDQRTARPADPVAKVMSSSAVAGWWCRPTA
jgi:hypothetical protein